ncbi:hyalin [Apostichopus japonicus]|uniref:Hyalin n=1 Tax=Stichopus japonicus TaxID=307972 RepID=A0A2G8KXR0_STIJA|nr:hyalin [Apostichopus japonicus]
MRILINTLTFTIISVDNIPPVINCPGDQTANTDISNSGVVVFFTEPTASDNSGTAILVLQTADPGDFFTVGTTPVTYTYRDPSNNQQSCTFNIVVVRVDNTPPVINCPGDQTANTDISNSGVVVFFTEPTASDNSGTAILVLQTADREISLQ